MADLLCSEDSEDSSICKSQALEITHAGCSMFWGFQPLKSELAMESALNHEMHIAREAAP